MTRRCKNCGAPFKLTSSPPENVSLYLHMCVQRCEYCGTMFGPEEPPPRTVTYVDVSGLSEREKAFLGKWSPR